MLRRAIGLAEGPFALHRIRNDQVEHELSYARTGSAIPASLHGIWWMDQRGVHLPQPSDPEYRQVVESSADELLVTWGDGAGWDPATRCVGRVPIYGGAAGHWTFMDVSASGTSGVFSSALDNRAMLDFCFTDNTMQTIDLHLYVKASSIVGSAPSDAYVELPMWAFHMSMERRPWGWDRVTRVLDAAALLQISPGLPPGLLSSLSAVEAHYPVFQIVDGDGQRTEHYPAYLAWADSPDSWPAYNRSACVDPHMGGEISSFWCPLNAGNGTQLVGRKATEPVVCETTQPPARVTLTAEGSIYCYEVESASYAEGCMLGAAEPHVVAVWPASLLGEKAILRSIEDEGSCVERGYTAVIMKSDPFYQGVDIYAAPGTSILQPTVDMWRLASDALRVGDSAWTTYAWAWAMTWIWLVTPAAIVDVDWWIPATEEALAACTPDIERAATGC